MGSRMPEECSLFFHGTRRGLGFLRIVKVWEDVEFF